MNKHLLLLIGIILGCPYVTWAQTQNPFFFKFGQLKPQNGEIENVRLTSTEKDGSHIEMQVEKGKFTARLGTLYLYNVKMKIQSSVIEPSQKIQSQKAHIDALSKEIFFEDKVVFNINKNSFLETDFLTLNPETKELYSSEKIITVLKNKVISADQFHMDLNKRILQLFKYAPKDRAPSSRRSSTLIKIQFSKNYQSYSYLK